MESHLANDPRLGRQPSQSLFPSHASPWTRTRIFLSAAALVAFSHAVLFAQAPSTEQGWPQNNQDAPYTADQSPAPQPYDEAASAVRQPLSAGQIEQLVAPIALYPDALVAQVLAASTYSQQVEEANRWRQAQGYSTPGQIADGADAQGWDPSVKALTAFPQVLAQMDRNLQWTTDLGNAYYNQPQDVLEAVQVMRQRAQAAGTLRSTPQEVVRYDGGNIVLAPADPQVVYVPGYNPWAVYGAPVAPYPGFSLLGAIAEFAGVLPIRYGLGIAISSFTQPWGWLAWGLDWLGHLLTFHDSAYYSHSRTVADWGFPHHTFYAYRGHEGFAHEYARMRGGDEWRRGTANSGGWRSFSRRPERPADHWNERASRGFETNRGFESSRGSQSFRGEHGGFERPAERMPADRGAYRSEFNHGAEGFRGNEWYRASAGAFPRNQFRGPSSENFGRSSAKSHSGLFGGGHSHNTFGSGGHTRNQFGGGHGSNNFGGSHGFGGGKSSGGGHSHGGGGEHSHGGGKHRH